MFDMAWSAWRGGIAHADADRRIEILPDLAAHEDHAAARDDGLAQIVVELLLRIGIARVEFT